MAAPHGTPPRCRSQCRPRPGSCTRSSWSRTDAPQAHSPGGSGSGSGKEESEQLAADALDALKARTGDRGGICRMGRDCQSTAYNAGAVQSQGGHVAWAETARAVHATPAVQAQWFSRTCSGEMSVEKSSVFVSARSSLQKRDAHRASGCGGIEYKRGEHVSGSAQACVPQRSRNLLTACSR